MFLSFVQEAMGGAATEKNVEVQVSIKVDGHTFEDHPTLKSLKRKATSKMMSDVKAALKKMYVKLRTCMSKLKTITRTLSLVSCLVVYINIFTFVGYNINE